MEKLLPPAAIALERLAMLRRSAGCCCAGAILTVVFATASPADDLQWSPLPSLPDREGFAGMFAGVSGETLLAAGGANFPAGRPWEGGTKVWYDTVFALDRPDGVWRTAGRLPRPLGYGVSVTHGGGVVCVGGSDATRHYPDVFRLSLHAGEVVAAPLPPLPIPWANGCGAVVGDILYVAGGQSSPEAREALDRVFRLDLAAPETGWREMEPCPGAPRILATAAGGNGAFWLCGGADLRAVGAGPVTRRYLQDAYRYDPATGWRRLADLPAPSVAAPSPTLTTSTGPIVLGGDDGTQLTATPTEHRGFSRAAWRYDTASDRWLPAGDLAAPRVTVPLVPWQEGWVLVSGELRPGVRSPEVWSVRVSAR